MTIPRRGPVRRGFTLIELLVVIGIILVLIAILLPVVSSVRKKAYEASTQQQMARIMAACQNYYHDWNSYPGPIPNVQLAGDSSPGSNGSYTSPSGVSVTISNVNGTITSSENLVLGLIGMITPPSTTGSPVTLVFTSPTANTAAPGPYTPHDVSSLNPLRRQNYHYIDYVADELTSATGNATELESMAGVSVTDSNVPEFVDRFPDKMPILYIRANRGNTDGAASTGGSGSLKGDLCQYNYDQVGMYGCNVQMGDGSGQSIMFNQSGLTNLNTWYNNATSQTNPYTADTVAQPYTGFWPASLPVTSGTYYFMNPNITGTTRGKDGFILIGAGLDRAYGTLDDIIVTP